MRLFVCYAFDDKPEALNVVDIVQGAHEVWLDDRPYFDRNHWEEVEERIAWCDGFLYLLSLESLREAHCLREYQIALNLDKIIFPVLLKPNVVPPRPLELSMCIDFSRDDAGRNVKALLDAIYKIERKLVTRPTITTKITIQSVIDEVDLALSSEDYEYAHHVLLHAIARGIQSRSIELLAGRVEDLLEEQIYDSGMRTEYQSIVELTRRSQTLTYGLVSFLSFMKNYPNYDPDNLKRQFADEIRMMNMGYVFISYSHDDRHIMDEVLVILKRHGIHFWVDSENLERRSNAAWSMAIERAIENAFCVVVLLSPSAKKSRWVNREIAYAENYKKQIIPALMLGSYNSSVPIRLISNQVIYPDKHGDIEDALIETIKNISNGR